MKSATPSDLFINLASVGDINDLETILMTWTENSGYPVVNVTRDTGDMTATLQQVKQRVSRSH